MVSTLKMAGMWGDKEARMWRGGLMLWGAVDSSLRLARRCVYDVISRFANMQGGVLRVDSSLLL